MNATALRLRPSEAPANPLFDAPEGHCPRCIAPRGAGRHCAKCGVEYARVSERDFRLSVQVAQRWFGVHKAWTDPAVHDRFMKLACLEGELAQVSRLYRIALARRPEDPMALRALERIVHLAAQTLVHAEPPEPFSGDRYRWVVVMVGVVAAGLWILPHLLKA